MLKCSRCQTMKPADDFSVDMTMTSRMNRRWYCRICASERRGGNGLRCIHCNETRPEPFKFAKFCSRECHIRHFTVIDPISQCWNWNGHVNEKGYGRIGIKRNRRSLSVSAHRMSYETFKDPIGRGLDILHLCHNRRCVNPDHLSPGTKKENNATHQQRISRGIDPESGMTRKEHAVAKWRGLLQD